MNNRIKRMVHQGGFIEIFFEEKARRPEESNELIFERINCEYEAFFGTPRYSSYNSFRQIRDRESRKR